MSAQPNPTPNDQSIGDRIRQRVAQGARAVGASLPQSKPIERSRELIRNANRWDKRVWREGVRPTDNVDRLITDLAIGDEHRGGTRKQFDLAPELVEAIFHTVYKANPRLEEPRRLEREMHGARKFVEEIQASPRLRELQDITVGDPVMSAVAIEAMSDQVKELIGRVPPPPPPPQPKPQPKDKEEPSEPGEPGDPGEPGQPGEPGGDDGDQPGGQPGNEPGDPGSGEGDDLADGDGEFDPDAEDMEQAEADWEAAYDEALKDLDIDRLANKALEAAQDEAEELEGLRKSIGLEDGEWQSMGAEDRLSYAERMRTPEMKELAQFIGQIKRFALGVKATRINDVPHEAYDVEQGNVLTRVLKAQFALLGHEQTKYEFYRRYASKELLQFKMRGTEEVGQGPMVMCIDKSTSMKGKPMMWAMGVAEALRRFAADEDRDYYALFFGTNNDRVRFEFPEGKGPFEKVMQFLGTQANGGTQFDGVLSEALQRATTQFDTAGKGKADIVFITDGQANLSEEWIKGFNDERSRVGVRVYSVYIGGASDMVRQAGPVALLNRISDVVIPVSDLKPQSVRQIFEKV